MKTRSVKWLTRLGSPVLLLLVLAGVIVFRGTWTTNEPKNPTAPEDGVTCQLFRGPDGRAVVRAAIVLDHAPEVVWSRLTAFERFPDMFATVKSFQVDAGSPARAKPSR